jgi:hypothetical protein
MLRHRFLDPRDEILLDRLDEFILAAKATIDIPDSPVGGLHDRSHGRVVDAARPQELLGGFDDLGERGPAAPLLRPTNVRRSVERRRIFSLGPFWHLLHCCQKLVESECKRIRITESTLGKVQRAWQLTPMMR